MQTSFEDLKISPALIEALKKQGITVPTPVQALTCPAFSEGKNLIVESCTGSGKTLAFLLPLFKKINGEKRSNQAVILAPTHELASQINKQIKQLSKESGAGITSMLIIGDVHIDNQIKKLKDKPQIIVGSPGRILDLMEKKKINAPSIETVILDEADNLLLHDQSGTVRRLFHTLNPDVQTALFSASIGKHIDQLKLPFSSAPLLLRTADTTTLNPLIEHYYIKGDLRDKFQLLKKLLQASNASKALIFVSQHTNTTDLMDKLRYHGFTAASVSGKLSKEARKKALEDFSSGKVQVLLSSDLSARGLDVPHITHVIHYDMPLTAEDYLHRAGRTARDGKKGLSICIMTPKDLGMLRILSRSFKIELSQLLLVKGRLKNLSTGDFLEASPMQPDQEKPKNRDKKNKYPKGFKKENQPSKPSPKKKKKKASSDFMEAFPATGSLSDALRLIEEAGFDD